MVCSFCKLNAAKYKCPACYILYCSVDCWKLHKKECVPVLRKNKEGCSDDLNKYKPNIYQYPTEDTVPYRKLQSLGERQEIKDLLCNPHLRHMLTAIDSTDNPTVAMQNAMLEPIFVEFADACLAVVDPFNEQ